MQDNGEQKLNELLALFQDEDKVSSVLLEKYFDEKDENDLIKELIHYQLNDNLKNKQQEPLFKIFDEI